MYSWSAGLGLPCEILITEEMLTICRRCVGYILLRMHSIACNGNFQVGCIDPEFIFQRDNARCTRHASFLTLILHKVVYSEAFEICSEHNLKFLKACPHW